MTAYTTARAMIRQAYNGKANLMTPNAIDFGWKRHRTGTGDSDADGPRYAWELSVGRGMSGNNVFGVSLATEAGKPEFKLSRAFSSEYDARAYIANGFRLDEESDT